MCIRIICDDVSVSDFFLEHLTTNPHQISIKALTKSDSISVLHIKKIYVYIYLVMHT